MANQANRMPPEVLSALQRGQTIQAIKLLRTATGLGLKDAKDAIDAQLSGKAFTLPSSGSAAPLPAEVLAALQSGNKIAAIKLLREHTRLGLKEAKNAVEASEQISAPATADQSPGKVKSSGGLAFWIAVAATVGIAAYYFMGRVD